MIDILIADDHDVFIEGLRSALDITSGINIKNIVKNGLEVIDELMQSNYDIVLLDVNMPVMNGIECAKKIKYYQFNTKILILTQYGEMKLVEKLMKYEINGYLLKSSTKKELIKAITAVYNNGKYFSKGVYPENPNRYGKNNRFNFYKCNFSKRELQVLNLICQGQKNSEIAKSLKISVHSVETFRQRIMVKSGMRNTAELVKWSVENDILSS